MLDRLFAPFEAVLIEAVAASDARSVLDIECGAGATSLAVARSLDARGSCTGIDISLALIEAACRRGVAARQGNAHFPCADAQRHAFTPGEYDMIISRFGVMFFDDPIVAFANIRSAVRPGGALACIVWRGRDDNPFMATADRAASEVLGPQPAHDPHAPGQFAFADDCRIYDILSNAGWSAIDIQPLSIPCEMTAAELHIYARRMGHVAAILPGLDDERRGALENALDVEFAPFIVDGMARFDAECWLIRAAREVIDHPAGARDARMHRM